MISCVCLRTGKTSLRVDCVLGEGAFATVYQATDLTTSEKFVLKVRQNHGGLRTEQLLFLTARLQDP